MRERVLGPDHPDTLVSHHEVAVALGWLGRWTEALPEYWRVADTRERILGADNPDALASSNDKAHCLEQQAMEMYRRVEERRQQGASGED
ncbi:MAG: tetratricopeptide repeat protein [Streptomyces sp.]|nr:tetratricopeptide repeat protein [Streptomyces sp.]